MTSTSEYSLLNKPSAQLWNSFLKRHCPEGNFLQCFEYGELAKMAYPKIRIVRLVVTYDEEPIGIAQGICHTHFGFGTTLNVSWGPIVSKTVENLHPVENIVSELEAYCRKRGIIEVVFSVYDYLNLTESFQKMNYTTKTPTNEYVVNLEGGAQKLWASIHHNKRRNIKTALEKGVEVIQSHRNEDLQTFYSLLKITAEREGFTPYPRALFDAIWNSYDRNLSCVFLAKWKKRSISGVFVVVQGKTAYAMNAGSLAEGREVRPTDIMHWRVMEWACERDYAKYNLGGVSEPPPTEGSNKWGIWRWKKEWKGNLERVEIFNKTILPQYRPLLKARDLVARLT